MTSSVDELRARVAAEHGVDLSAVTVEYGEPMEPVTVLVNSNVKMSPHKLASQVAHAVLMHYGIRHGSIVVLGATPSKIEAQCHVQVRDAGLTEVTPGTLTAGVRRNDQPS